MMAGERQKFKRSSYISRDGHPPVNKEGRRHQTAIPFMNGRGQRRGPEDPQGSKVSVRLSLPPPAARADGTSASPFFATPGAAPCSRRAFKL